MAEFNKWTECDDPDAPASRFVNRALRERLDAVAAMLEPAARIADRDPEAVHQLRVATRRTAAALAAFADFLPRRRRKRLHKTLAKIRRAAGAARDLDVVAERYGKASATLPDAALDWLWTRLVSERRAVQPPIVKLAQCRGKQRVDRIARRMRTRLGYRGCGNEPTFRQLSREKLGAAAGEFFAIADRQPEKSDDLHALRIAGKHLRYSIELFWAAFPMNLRDEVYPLVEQVQERLGVANDHEWAAKVFDHWRNAEHRRVSNVDVPPPVAAVTSLVDAETAAAEKSRRDFLSWWTNGHYAQVKRGLDSVLATTLYERRDAARAQSEI